jgi:hypothetical protein
VKPILGRHYRGVLGDVLVVLVLAAVAVCGVLSAAYTLYEIDCIAQHKVIVDQTCVEGAPQPGLR